MGGLHPRDNPRKLCLTTPNWPSLISETLRQRRRQRADGRQFRRLGNQLAILNASLKLQTAWVSAAFVAGFSQGSRPGKRFAIRQCKQAPRFVGHRGGAASRLPPRVPAPAKRQCAEERMPEVFVEERCAAGKSPTGIIEYSFDADAQGHGWHYVTHRFFSGPCWFPILASLPQSGCARDWPKIATQAPGRDAPNCLPQPRLRKPIRVLLTLLLLTR